MGVAWEQYYWIGGSHFWASLKFPVTFGFLVAHWTIGYRCVFNFERLPSSPLEATFSVFAPKKDSEPEMTMRPRKFTHTPKMDVSENSGFSPKSSILMGFSTIFTIHFGVFTPILECSVLCLFGIDHQSDPFASIWIDQSIRDPGF